MNKSQRTLLFSPMALLLGLTILVYQLMAGAAATAVASPSSPAAPNNASEWKTPITITNMTNAPNGASGAVVKASPDGETVMVAFNWERDDTANDPYYRRSLDRGETWSPVTPIVSSTVQARAVHLDYGSTGIAHAVWISGTENAGLIYSRESSPNSDTWTAPIALVAAGKDPGVTNPYIVASNNNRVDIVWAEGDSTLPDPDPNIYHARSNDGGSSWPVGLQGIITSTNFLSQFPAMVVEPDGTIHVVYQNDDNLIFDPPPPRFAGTIYYVQGNETAGSIQWSSPVPISTVDDAREPEITIINGVLHVVYTDFVDTDTEYLYHTKCKSQCTTENGWHSSGQVSGQLVGANGVEPLNIVSSLVHRGNCAIAYFHGIAQGSDEQIMGTNSCSGWDAGPRDYVTQADVQSINPSLAVQNDWWLYLTYEQNIGGVHQIYFHRAAPDIMLPAIFNSGVDTQ